MHYTFENKFCDIVQKLQNISTDGSVRKFARDSPLGKFIENEAILSEKQIMCNELHHLVFLNLEYINYKEPTVVELLIIFDQLTAATFTITEILLSIPNAKDEERYARGYSFKSKIVAYVDFDETISLSTKRCLNFLNMIVIFKQLSCPTLSDDGQLRDTKILHQF